ncbi:caspase family protein [Streptomyces sp. NBC_01351]|uniref:caspase, EACC1-associated type n=1 Tax=Streptomyces sp. NBC_01351 TaxID=2903833 RepID=UPI002E322301|nr:hypothetical protein [Streptomyces sp. NBC_01351]
MAVREALVVATSSYEDTRLNQLNSPGLDATGLSEVLSDPAIGGYAVRSVIDQPAHVVRREIERFFIRRKPDDQLLLYLSCHGIKDSRLQLYFAATDTDRDLLESTSVPAVFVNGRLIGCNSRKILVLLDCCYSGAFKPGGAKSADRAVHLLEEFKDTGVAVITATDALQQAWEGDGPVTETGEGQLSVFTAAAVGGLRSGRADRDGDGWVSVEDLYEHVREEMLARDARQSPLRWILGGQGTLKVARRAPLAVVAAVPEPGSVPEGGSASGLRAGIAPVAGLLRRTLGPRPRPALLALEDGSLSRTTDPGRIVERIPPGTGYSALGHQLAVDLFGRMEREAGDGRVTAVVVLDALTAGIQPLLDGGAHPVQVDRVLGRLLEGAERKARRLGALPYGHKEYEALFRTAMGDPVMPRDWAGSMTEPDMHMDGIMSLRRIDSPEDEYSQEGTGYFIEGGRVLDDGSVPPDLPAEAVEDPAVLLCAVPIPSLEPLRPLLKEAAEAGRRLVVVAPEVGAPAFDEPPRPAEYFGIRPRGTPSGLGLPPEKVFHDLSVVTGGTVVRSVQGLTGLRLDELGRAGLVLADRRSAVFVPPQECAGQVALWVAALRAEAAKETDYVARAYRARRAARFGAEAVIAQGVVPPAEREVFDRVVSAIRVAVQTADDGAVPGTAAALTEIGHNRLPQDYAWQPSLARPLRDALALALAAPLAAIAENNGEEDPGMLVDEVRRHWPALTYDALGGGLTDPVRAAVLEPVTVALAVLRAVRETTSEYLSLL